MLMLLRPWKTIAAGLQAPTAARAGDHRAIGTEGERLNVPDSWISLQISKRVRAHPFCPQIGTKAFIDLASEPYMVSDDECKSSRKI